MKKIILLLLLGISLSGFSQKKIKFNKDIFPLLESKDFATATPLLLDFVTSNPNNTKANYWAGAIFYGRVAAFDKQLSSGERLLTQSCFDVLDSSILFLSTCKKWLNAATLNLFNAKYYPDFSGSTAEELLADGLNDLGRWINLLNEYKTNWKKYKLYTNEEITELRKQELARQAETDKKNEAFEAEFNVHGCSEPEQNDMIEVKRCTYRNLKRSIMVVTESEWDERDCKFGCHSKTYISKTGGESNYNEVQLHELFGVQEGELRIKINQLLKKDFNQMKSEYPDCLEGSNFSDVSWSHINLSISEDGFSFNTLTGAANNCMVAGEISARFTFEQIDHYIGPHVD